MHGSCLNSKAVSGLRLSWTACEAPLRLAALVDIPGKQQSDCAHVNAILQGFSPAGASKTILLQLGNLGQNTAVELRVVAGLFEASSDNA